MDPTIIVAIIGAFALIVVAIINVRGKGGKPPAKPEKPPETPKPPKPIKPQKPLKPKDKARVQAELTVIKILNDERWEKRTFATLKKRLKGFNDNEIRDILHAVGAVSFEGEDGEELWGLKKRNPDDVSSGIQKFDL